MSNNQIWAGNGQINDRVLYIKVKFNKNGSLPKGYQFDFRYPERAKRIGVSVGRVVETGLLNEHKVRRNIAVRFDRVSSTREFEPDCRVATPAHNGTWAKIEELLLLPQACELPEPLKAYAKQHNLFVSRRIVNGDTPRYRLHCNQCAGEIIHECNSTESSELSWNTGGFVTGKPCISGGEGEYLICDRCSRKLEELPDDIETWS